MIRLEHVCKSYRVGEQELQILHDLSLRVAASDFIAIMGPSGSGKTTLTNIIGCLDTFDSGSYTLNDVTIGGRGDDLLANVRNKQIGFVFQLFNLIPRIDALRNIELPLVYSGVSSVERRRRSLEALKRVGLSDRASHTPAQLSGGQQQRVAIARALAGEPRFLLADEPTGNLDSEMAESVMQLLEEINEKGTTIIMVTHEHNLAERAKRNIFVHDGRISSGEPKLHVPIGDTRVLRMRQ